MRIWFLGIAIVMLAVAPVAAETDAAEAAPTAKKTKTSPLRLGAMSGLGYDSNLFNKKTPTTDAFSNETTLKSQYRVQPAKRLRWTSGAGLTSSYRYAASDTQAWALRVVGRTGLDWKMFGGGSKKDFRPSGRLGAGIGYNGNFNPTLKKPATPVDDDGDGDIDPDDGDGNVDAGDEIDDQLQDEFSLDAIDDFADADDWDDDSNLDDEGTDDAFFDEDPLGGSLFGSKPMRNLLTPAVRANFKPWEPTSLGMLARYTRAWIDEPDPSKPSSDYMQAGGAIRWSQRIVPRRFDLTLGFDFAYRWYEQKLTKAFIPLDAWSLGAVVGTTLRPTSRLKVIVSYRYGARLVPPDESTEGDQHVGRVGFQYRLIKNLWLFQENSALYSGLQSNNPPDPLNQNYNTSSKDAFRYQGMLGMRWTM